MRHILRSVRSRLTSSLNTQRGDASAIQSVPNGLEPHLSIDISEHRGIESDSGPPLKIARYGLVLMDPDGQVVWTRDWDAGGVFEFGPRQHLWIFCRYTNHSGCEAEISEYEIELMNEEGLILDRFNDSFGDSVVVQPGESKHFQAEWVQK